MLTPSAGVRYLFERLAPESGARCRYATTIATPEATYKGEAALDAEGSAALHFEEPEPPEDLAAQLAVFARLVARGANARTAEGLGQWPDRVQRWRPRKPAP